MERPSDNQIDNSSKPWLWKKGQSGNLAGRPKGKTMKEYAKELLSCQTEEQRQDFLDGLPKEIVWKMAEGNPTSETNSNIKINATDEIKKLAGETISSIGGGSDSPEV